MDSIENQNDKFPKEVEETFSSYKNALTKNTEEYNKTQKCVTSTKESIVSLETNLNSKIAEDNNSFKAINKDLKSVKSNIDKSAEAQSQAQKSNNICVFNVPEQESDDQDVNYKQDVEIIKGLFSDHIHLNKEDVKGLYRIPRLRNSNATKPRPIIIRFATLEKRNEALKLRNLLHKDTKGEHKIYITPDRTKREQAEHKKLVEQLKLRKAKGEENLVIRNGKIVEWLPFRANPQYYWG